MNKVVLLFCSLLLVFACKKDETARLKNSLSISDDTENWMYRIVSENSDRDISLYDLSLPGAHDAGMYVLNQCTFGTNACNTQTQENTFTQMLNDGVRIFDVRPSFFNNKLYTQHGDCGFFNCKGDLLENILNQTNTFLETHHELVIFELGLFCDTSPDDTLFRNLVIRKLGNKIYKEPIPDVSPFIHRPLKNILNDITGKILLLADVNDTPGNRAVGFFPRSFIPRSGSWTNSQTYAHLQSNQGLNFQNFSNDGTSLFSFSWQITLNEVQSIACALDPNAPSIKKNAMFINKKLNRFLDSLTVAGELQHGRIPGIIYSDFTDTLISKQCISISLKNLE